MAAERLSLRQIREILRQKWALGLRHRAVARSLGGSAGPDQQRRHPGQRAGQDWLQVQPLSSVTTSWKAGSTAAGDVTKSRPSGIGQSV